jgi:signal transduction histidine kinase
MFERFFRASNAGNVEGTGLGLNIVKRYVNLLNGDISFTSEYGKGSTFIVQIPIQ